MRKAARRRSSHGSFQGPAEVRPEPFVLDLGSFAREADRHGLIYDSIPRQTEWRHEIVLRLRSLAAAPRSPAPPTPAAPAEGDVYSSHLMVDQDVIVSCQITGVIETIHVDRGSAVAKGQTLATLAHAGVRRRRPRGQGETWSWPRRSSTGPRPSRRDSIMSKADLDDGTAQYAVAVARWEKAKAIRDYAVIRAPFAGVVTEKYARIGQKVIDDQNEPLFKITATEPLLARIYLPEQDLLKVRAGTRSKSFRTISRRRGRRATVQFISPTRRRRRAAPSRSSSRSAATRRSRSCAPGWPSRCISPTPAGSKGDRS